jgi:hypothetical protein
MHEQTELFPAVEYVELSHGMTDKSTKRKKRSPSRKETIAFFNARKLLKITD